MSCATHPELCGTKELVLRGPILSPPKAGWKIVTLPERAQHLMSEWVRHPGDPGSSKAAWGQLMDFLKTNNIPVTLKEVKEISIPQWCDPDPFRCPGYKKRTFLPWAKKAWEEANVELQDPIDPASALKNVVEALTKKINGKDGCPRCAKRWARYLKANPVPSTPTISQARHWLVDAHNHTREGKPATAFSEVATKFSWITL